jgi:hypothetical protein
MSRLLRLYPRAWRDRYGDEMAAILESRPLGMAGRLDLLAGALDAQLRDRRRGDIPASGVVVHRAVAVPAVAAGLLWVIVVAAFGVATDLPAGVGIGSLTLAILLTLVAEIGLVRAMPSRAACSLTFAIAPAVGGALMMVIGWLALAVNGDVAEVAGYPAYLVWFLGAMGTMLLLTLPTILLVRVGAVQPRPAREVGMALVVQGIGIVAGGILDAPFIALLGAVVLGAGIAHAGVRSARRPAAT